MPEQCQQFEAEPAVCDIAFGSDHEICRGVHYLPSIKTGVDPCDKFPCVILAHGFGGTADAGLHPYARAFAASGLHSIVFDYRHFGASEGTPRQLVSLHRQREDWHAAIAFARAQKDIDADRIILWGVSLSGGHVIDVAARDGRISAVIAQYPMLDGLAALRNIYCYAGPGQILKLLATGVRDMLGGLLAGSTRMIPIVGPPGKLAALSTADAEPGYRAIVPAEWHNAVCARIALAIPFYRPGFLLRRIASPVFIQIADRDSILPPASIERFVPQEHSSIKVEHYQSGHFDAFSGDLFRLAVTDQINFILTTLDVPNHESNTA